MVLKYQTPKQTTTPSLVTQFISAMHNRFGGMGVHTVEQKQASIVHFPHLVSLRELSKQEQQEQIELLVKFSIKELQKDNITYTIRDTGKVEGTVATWHRFHVEVTIPKE